MKKQPKTFKNRLNDIMERITLKEIIYGFLFLALVIVGYKYYIYKTQPKVVVGEFTYSQEELDKVRNDILLENN